MTATRTVTTILATASFAFVAAVILVFFAGLAYAFLVRRRAASNQGVGATTSEWTLPSPPPFHTFETLPHDT